MKTVARLTAALTAAVMLGLAVAAPAAAEFIPAEQHPRFIAKVKQHAATVQGAVMTKAGAFTETARSLGPGE